MKHLSDFSRFGESSVKNIYNTICESSYYENFDYYIDDNDTEVQVSREEFLDYGIDHMGSNQFKIDIQGDRKIVGKVLSV